MKKIVSGVSAGVLIVAGLTWWFVTLPPLPPAVAIRPVDGGPPAHRPTVSVEAAAYPPCTPRVPDAGKARQFSIARLAGQVQAALSAGLDEPEAVRQEAEQGQPAAAIAMLYLAANCSRFRGRFEFFGLVPDDVALPSSATCHRLAPPLRRNPLATLDSVLPHSAEARLLAAANGLVVHQVRLADGANVQGDQLAAIERNALSAAGAGLAEANLFLAMHYDDGSLGPADARKAMYFAQNFHPDRADPGAAARLAYFKQRLASEGPAAGACGTGAGTQLINPFSGAQAAN